MKFRFIQFFSLIGPPINCDVNDKIENIRGQTVPKPKIQSTAKAYAIKASSVWSMFQWCEKTFSGNSTQHNHGAQQTKLEIGQFD